MVSPATKKADLGGIDTPPTANYLVVHNPAKCSVFWRSTQGHGEISFPFGNHPPHTPLFSLRSQTATSQLAGFRNIYIYISTYYIYILYILYIYIYYTSMIYTLFNGWLYKTGVAYRFSHVFHHTWVLSEALSYHGLPRSGWTVEHGVLQRHASGRSRRRFHTWTEA